jgi:dUTP pyrophosphatase
MEVKIKKLVENAIVPKYAHETDAGLDLTATSMELDEYGNVVYHTGLAFEIPKGYVGYIFPRSSISKYSLQLTNSVGVIDSGYRGEVLFKFKTISNKKDFKLYEVGERIGQLIIMPYPNIELVEVDELSSTDRNEGGFGSSGK